MLETPRSELEPSSSAIVSCPLFDSHRYLLYYLDTDITSLRLLFDFQVGHFMSMGKSETRIIGTQGLRPKGDQRMGHRKMELRHRTLEILESRKGGWGSSKENGLGNYSLAVRYWKFKTG